MTAMLTADWFLLGRNVYYRKFEIYSMEWQQEVNMENVIISGAQYGGPIAVIRDSKKFVKVQGAAKQVIAIYSGSGHQISSMVWNRPTPVALGWSDRENLLCVQDDGSVYIHDMFGSFLHVFNIGMDSTRYNSKVVDAKIYNSMHGTGVAILTSNMMVLLINNVHEPKTRQLGSDSGSGDITCWAIIPGERSTEVLVACGRELYRLKEDDVVSTTVEMDQQDSRIVQMAVSLNGQHMALLTESGRLWMGSVDLRSKYREVVCQEIGSLTWCGTDAVLLCHSGTITIIGKRSDDTTVSYAYDGAAHLVPEVDGVRILTSTQHELMQKVPDVVQKIFRINSTEPGSYLLEASRQYQKRSHRADEYVSLVRGELEQAVRQCLEAAGHEFETDTQKMLVRAAQFGKCFLQGAADSIASSYVFTCRLLRVLNAVRDPRIGVPLTCVQLNGLTCEALLDRLINRRHFYLAMQAADYLRLPERDGRSRILTRWAEHKVTAGRASSNRQMQNEQQVDEDALARQIADRIGRQSGGVSFSGVACTAAACGRKRLAIGLLEHEPRARLQVPLLLQLGETSSALLKAIESGDTDLMHTVILHMRENMPLADFRMTIRNYPVAQALYKRHCREHNRQALAAIHIQEDDFGAQADAHLADGLQPSAALTRDASLAAAQEAYRRARSELSASLCEESRRLLVHLRQSTFAGVSDSDMSVHDACAYLLASGETKAADRLRAEFKIPERRYWWLRVRNLAVLGDWIELERLSKLKKSPIGYAPFVDACIEHANLTEAVKYLSRVSDELKIKYYVKTGLCAEAAKIAFEQRNIDGLLYVQRRCATIPDNQHIVEKVNTFLAQLSTQKK